MKDLKSESVLHVGENFTEKILSLISPVKYNTKTKLFYEGQTPIVAYLIIEGHIQLIKNKKPLKLLNPGDLIGVKELMNHTPCPVSAEIFPNTKVCFLDKSTILELINGQDKAIVDLLSIVTKPSIKV